MPLVTVSGTWIAFGMLAQPPPAPVVAQALPQTTSITGFSSPVAATAGAAAATAITGAAQAAPFTNVRRLTMGVVVALPSVVFSMQFASWT